MTTDRAAARHTSALFHLVFDQGLSIQSAEERIAEAHIFAVETWAKMGRESWARGEAALLRFIEAARGGTYKEPKARGA